MNAAATTTAQPTFTKQSLYHSDLREASPLTVRFRTGVEASQFRGRGHFVGLSIAGDDTDYTYSIENERIRAFLEQVLSQDPDATTWYRLHASGKKDAAQLELTATNGDAKKLASDRQKHAQPAPRPEPLPELGRRSSPTRRAIAVELWECLESAHEVVAYFQRQFNRQPTEAELRLAAELFNQQQREDANRPVRRERTKKEPRP
jgi:hypothetical protein